MHESRHTFFQLQVTVKRMIDPDLGRLARGLTRCTKTAAYLLT